MKPEFSALCALGILVLMMILGLLAGPCIRWVKRVIAWQRVKQYRNLYITHRTSGERWRENQRQIWKQS